MRNDLVLIKLIEIIEKIRKYVSDVDYESFSSNDILVDACVFN